MEPITNFKDYLEYFEDIGEPTTENIEMIVGELPKVYQNVLMNCLDPKDRCRILADMLAFMFGLPQVMTASENAPQGLGCNDEGVYNPPKMDEYAKTIYQ